MTQCSAVAVKVALWLLPIGPAVAVNVAEADPAAMLSELTLKGSRALLLDSNTPMPPAGAASVSVTVQAIAIPDVTLLGLQISCETWSGYPSAALENDKIATARLLDGFDKVVVREGLFQAKQNTSSALEKRVLTLGFRRVQHVSAIAALISLVNL